MARNTERATAVRRGRKEMLHLWYGGLDMTSRVVLACEAIPLIEIQRSQQPQAREIRDPFADAPTAARRQERALRLSGGDA